MWLKVYNGRFETIFNPDRLYIYQSYSDWKSIYVGKYFGVNPAGELEGITEEIVRVYYTFVYQMNLLLNSVNAPQYEALNTAVKDFAEDKISKEEFIKRTQTLPITEEQLSHLADFIQQHRTSMPSLKEDGLSAIGDLIRKVENQIDHLLIELKNSFAREEILDQPKIEQLVNKSLQKFKSAVIFLTGFVKLPNLLKVEIFPFP